jgi:Tfp pilus assembly protein PilX
MQTRAGRFACCPAGESGAVLILSLLLLMVLTLLGVAALTGSRIELQLAANDRAHKQALAAADVGLAIGETVIESWADGADLDEHADADDGRYGIAEQPAWGYLKWDAACDGPPGTCRGGSETVSASDLPAGMAYVLSNPQILALRYAIERLPTAPDSYVTGAQYHGPRETAYFRVSARGVAPTGIFGGQSSRVILESIYAKRFN